VPLQLQMIPSEMLPLNRTEVAQNGNAIRQGIEFDRRSVASKIAKSAGNNQSVMLRSPCGNVGYKRRAYLQWTPADMVIVGR
jgi:hypothetical protein